MLQLEPERAIEVLPFLVSDADARKTLLDQVRVIAGAGDPLTPAENDRMARLSQLLAASSEKRTVSAARGQPTGSRAPVKTNAVLH